MRYLILLAIIAALIVVRPTVTIAEPAFRLEYGEVHQNDYYCEQIRDRNAQVTGASSKEIQKLCAEWGVTL